MSEERPAEQRIDVQAERIRQLEAEVDRLRAGIEALIRTGYDHTPDCVREREMADSCGEPFWHPDCGRCWEDSLHALLDPIEGETDE